MNVGLTLRNWLIGAYIAEYELRGEDRARYGEGLISKLSNSLKTRGIAACEQQRLSGYRLVYRAFPQIKDSLAPEFGKLLPFALLARGDKPSDEIYRTVSGESPAEAQMVAAAPESATHPIARTASGKLRTPGKMLIERLSYSHLELLAPVEPPLVRTFYEIECIKGGWSVRELKRQIGSLYFERSGLSKDKEALSRMANELAEVETPALVIRDPFVFDFLGIPAAHAMSESDLEAALMGHLQEFLLELGRGFCFEARQKRILIGGEYFFCDLVFYHRLLKCHVLIELKVDEFRHKHLGQLNTYVA